MFDQLGSDLILKKVTTQDPYFEIQTIDKKKGWINGSLKDNEAPEGADLHYADLAQLTFVHSNLAQSRLTLSFRPGDLRFQYDANVASCWCISRGKGNNDLYWLESCPCTKTSYAIPGTDISVTLIKRLFPIITAMTAQFRQKLRWKKGTKQSKLPLDLVDLMVKGWQIMTFWLCFWNIRYNWGTQLNFLFCNVEYEPWKQ